MATHEPCEFCQRIDAGAGHEAQPPIQFIGLVVLEQVIETTNPFFIDENLRDGLASFCPDQEFPVHPRRRTKFFFFIGHAFGVKETLRVDASTAALVGVDLNLDHVDASR